MQTKLSPHETKVYFCPSFFINLSLTMGTSNLSCSHSYHQVHARSPLSSEPITLLLSLQTQNLSFPHIIPTIDFPPQYAPELLAKNYYSCSTAFCFSFLITHFILFIVCPHLYFYSSISMVTLAWWHTGNPVITSCDTSLMSLAKGIPASKGILHSVP